MICLLWCCALRFAQLLANFSLVIRQRAVEKWLSVCAPPHSNRQKRFGGPPEDAEWHQIQPQEAKHVFMKEDKLSGRPLWRHETVTGNPPLGLVPGESINNEAIFTVLGQRVGFITLVQIQTQKMTRSSIQGRLTVDSRMVDKPKFRFRSSDNIARNALGIVYLLQLFFFLPAFHSPDKVRNPAISMWLDLRLVVIDSPCW